jgi:hypothetical protein
MRGGRGGRGGLVFVIEQCLFVLKKKEFCLDCFTKTTTIEFRECQNLCHVLEYFSLHPPQPHSPFFFFFNLIPGALSIHVFHAAGRNCTADELRKFDVVITTYVVAIYNYISRIFLYFSFNISFSSPIISIFFLSSPSL